VSRGTEQAQSVAEPSIWATKPAEDLIAETHERGSELKRAIGVLDLTALGVGAIVGTGIFVVIGQAVSDAGPAVVIAFALAAVSCLFSALAYAELASTIPVAGSAYTYTYATLGEIVAFVIGWDLLLEWGLAAAAVSVGWGQYFNDMLDSLAGATLPDSIVRAPGEGGIVNVPAVVVVLAATTLLIIGVKESVRVNTAMVFVKVGILGFFIVLGATAFDAAHFSPFATGGVGGTVSAAAVIFLAYIGFDAVATSSEESKRPGRDLPIATVASLAIATFLYTTVALVATGALPVGELARAEAPLAAVLRDGAGYSWGASIISAGAVIAISSVLLTVLYAQTRILFAMCRDGLLPQGFAKVWRRTRTPALVTAPLGSLVAVIAALVPLGDLVKLVNIGTLFAFLVVNIAIIVLRRTRPDLPRSFRVPLVPWFPLIGAGTCIYLMSTLATVTWIGFAVWLVIGLYVYAAYGHRHSRLRLDSGVRLRSLTSPRG
jgi:basic amino acid/polyamine antiporter, APA family